MTVLTIQAALALALQCGISRSVAPIIVGIAQHESGLETTAIHRNPNLTIDAGLVGLNQINWGWNGIHSIAEALEPCRNFRAGVAVLFVRYNGNPRPAVAAAYAADVTARIDRVDSEPRAPLPRAEPVEVAMHDAVHVHRP